MRSKSSRSPTCVAGRSIGQVDSWADEMRPRFHDNAAQPSTRFSSAATSLVRFRIPFAGIAVTIATACSGGRSAAGVAANSPSGDSSKPSSVSASAAGGGANRLSGRLPPVLIQSIVRERYPQFQRCYISGLGRDPQLEGEIKVRFIITRDGSVPHVAVGGSTLLDTEVIRCVVREFYQMHFPPPNGGTVSVVYPLKLSPR